jgi:hypothetical protein
MPTLLLVAHTVRLDFAVYHHVPLNLAILHSLTDELAEKLIYRIRCRDAAMCWIAMCVSLRVSRANFMQRCGCLVISSELACTALMANSLLTGLAHIARSESVNCKQTNTEMNIFSTHFQGCT